MDGCREKQLKTAFRDVINGKTPIYSEFFKTTFFVKHVDTFLAAEVDSVFKISFDKAKNDGVDSEEDRMKLLIKEGIWTKENELELDDLTSFIANLKKSKSKCFLQKDIGYFQSEIDKSTLKLNQLQDKRRRYIGISAESYATKRANEFFIFLCLYRDEDLKVHYFSAEDFEELDFQELNELALIYESYVKLINSDNLKRISVASFFVNLFYLCEDNPYTFYGKPVVNLTFNQSELFSYGKYFKHLMSEIDGKVPEHFKDNPDKIIELHDSEKNAADLVNRTQTKDNQVVSIVGATKDDMKNLNFDGSQGSSATLAKEAKKKGGVLGIQDIMKIQGF